MATDSSALDATALRNSLRPPWTRVDVVAETGSTNADLIDAVGEKPSGTVLAAEYQWAGRGRLDRVWTSPARVALTFSVLLRPSAPVATWGWLPLLTGLAVCDAVAAHAGLEPGVKWPNDVLIGTGDGERKVAGILARVRDDAVVIGIGLNVNTQPPDLPVPSATSLLVATGVVFDRTQLLCEVLGELGARFEQWDDAGGDPGAGGLGADYRDRSVTIGRVVNVSQTDGSVLRGTAADVDDVGALVLEVDGQRLHVAAGDVQHVR